MCEGGSAAAPDDERPSFSFSGSKSKSSDAKKPVAFVKSAPVAFVSASSKKKTSKFSSSFSPPPQAPAAEKKKKKKPKKKNIDLFLEEMKASQAAQGHRSKASAPAPLAPLPDTFRREDPTSTNIYLKNLSLQSTEQQLLEHFAQYGAVASVKVMWPRTEEEKERTSNRGFVSFMQRRDAEKCMRKVHTVHGKELILGWGKPVNLPSVPLSEKIEYDRKGERIIKRTVSREAAGGPASVQVELPSSATRIAVLLPSDKVGRRKQAFFGMESTSFCPIIFCTTRFVALIAWCCAGGPENDRSVGHLRRQARARL